MRVLLREMGKASGVGVGHEEMHDRDGQRDVGREGDGGGRGVPAEAGLGGAGELAAGVEFLPAPELLRRPGRGVGGGCGWQAGSLVVDVIGRHGLRTVVCAQRFTYTRPWPRKHVA